MNRPTAEELQRSLQLQPHPTCGFVHESFRSSAEIPATDLPGFDGSRRRGSVLYFMVTPRAHMALHRIRPEQMYHHYLGDPLDVLLLPPGEEGRVERVGSPADGLRPQLFIPAETWHVSRLAAGGEYALLATTEWPAVEPDDVDVADVERLVAEHPALADRIRSFAHDAAAEPLRR